MELMVDKILSVGGPLGVLVIVVWLFVKASQARDATNQAFMATMLKNNQDWIQRMHEDHISARVETRAALEKNSTALTENTVASKELSFTVKALTKTQ